MRKALSVIDFSEVDIDVRISLKCTNIKVKQKHYISVLNTFSLNTMQNLFAIIASVLHLGNIKFEADARGYATVRNNQEMHWVSKVGTVHSVYLSLYLS